MSQQPFHGAITRELLFDAAAVVLHAPAVDTVVVGTDGSGPSMRAVEHAAWIAAASDAKLIITTAYVHHGDEAPYHHSEEPRAEDLLKLKQLTPHHDRLVGVFCLAALLVPRVPADDYAIVVHGDLACLQVDGPTWPAHPAAADPGGQFQQDSAANRSWRTELRKV